MLTADLREIESTLLRDFRRASTHSERIATATTLKDIAEEGTLKEVQDTLQGDFINAEDSPERADLATILIDIAEKRGEAMKMEPLLAPRLTEDFRNAGLSATERLATGAALARVLTKAEAEGKKMEAEARRRLTQSIVRE
jgi:hypothetical protein